MRGGGSRHADRLDISPVQSGDRKQVRPEGEGLEVDWKIATKRCKRKQPGNCGPDGAERKRKASAPARVEHPIRRLKRCFKCSKVRPRDPCRNRQRVAPPPGVTNLTMAGRHAAAWPGTIAFEEHAWRREQGFQIENSPEFACFRGRIPDSGLTFRRNLPPCDV